MKRIIVTMLALLTLLCTLVCCTVEKDNGIPSDLESIQDRGVLVVGITDSAPMNYQGKNGSWIGFDADMAKAFAEYLELEVEFKVIEWENKTDALNNGEVDAIWNGLTLTADVLEAMECTVPYCNNAQVVILPKDKADIYPTTASMQALTFAVEAGSAGKEQAELLGFNTIYVSDQAAALYSVYTGSADAAVIDLLMAGAMIGDGTIYPNLTHKVQLNSEEYGVGFRKGSNAAEKLNEFFKKAYEDGTMTEIAEIYGVQAAIIPQK